MVIYQGLLDRYFCTNSLKLKRLGQYKNCDVLTLDAKPHKPSLGMLRQDSSRTNMSYYENMIKNL